MRRFRISVLVTLFLVVAIYEISRLNDWDVNDIGSLSNFGFKHDETKSAVPEPNFPPPTDYSPTVEAVEQKPQANPEPAEDPEPAETPVEEDVRVAPVEEQKSEHEDEINLKSQSPIGGKGRTFWKPHKDHFPVDAYIDLPVGKRKPLPQIQYEFDVESASKKSDRMRKQTAIREAFKHAWSGYSKHAIGHDELKPLSNATNNPFNGWGATLVDALDTMWIMGLKEEFENAVKHVAKIDFTTSRRKDIPLFETTIRYLGGLIAAYDISDAKHPILLDKAVELADILLGAFDTPNHMPIPFYKWSPSDTSKERRASTRIVMAELGSLAVEFTRLSQITKDPKYYDVIARVTTALEEWQMKTTYPGVWPVRLDASGCKTPRVATRKSIKESEDNTAKLVRRQEDDISATEDVEEDSPGDEDFDATEFDKEKEDFAEYSDECEPKGLDVEPYSKKQTYSIAAMADSTYEYFPKQYALLGGLEEQYRSMYSDSMDVIREDFLFRPMIKEKRDILFLTKYDISPQAKHKSEKKKPIYEATHLGCFAGAMFALGSKVFDIPSDMPLAEKLTDACVWAYESTPVGVMAEEFELVPCEDKLSCTWNETRWYEFLDPDRADRFAAAELYNRQQESIQKRLPEVDDVEDETEKMDPSSKQKRQLDDLEDEEAAPRSKSSHENYRADFSESAGSDIFNPKIALSHRKYVEARISEERLPPGYTEFHSREYKLRPEAIESVFVMYRLTGDEGWREKGWKMFDAIDRATRTRTAHAAVKDVTSQLGAHRDSMESFWLAETLKYFYLLFSEESLVSLDEWVLNTEAHPFRLPK
jgi:mannosyl-oligosaccharide alpha-1,2-mannosidase